MERETYESAWGFFVVVAFFGVVLGFDFFIEVLLICNIILVSGVQHSDSKFF